MYPTFSFCSVQCQMIFHFFSSREERYLSMGLSMFFSFRCRVWPLSLPQDFLPRESLVFQGYLKLQDIPDSRACLHCSTHMLCKPWPVPSKQCLLQHQWSLQVCAREQEFIHESSQARVCMRVSSTLMSWSNKSCTRVT